MRKKTILTAGFILLLFLIVIAGACFVKIAQANPYMYHEWVSPPEGATPVEISISSPRNNAVCRVNDIALTFNISTKNTSMHYLLGAYFKADWMQDNVTVYKQNTYSPEFPKFWDYNEIFWGIPDGEHSIVITAWGGGGYAKGLTYYFFDMTTISVINFTIDGTPPKVSVLSLENKTYDLFDVPLNFSINESVLKISYVLDGQSNVTVAGNTTLTGLSEGEHDVTVYATDNAGNTGASETLYFTVDAPESLPTELVTVTGVSLSAGFVSVGLAVYSVKIKKRGKSMKRTTSVAGLFCRKNSIKGGEA